MQLVALTRLLATPPSTTACEEMRKAAGCAEKDGALKGKRARGKEKRARETVSHSQEVGRLAQHKEEVKR